MFSLKSSAIIQFNPMVINPDSESISFWKLTSASHVQHGLSHWANQWPSLIHVLLSFLAPFNKIDVLVFFHLLDHFSSLEPKLGVCSPTLLFFKLSFLGISLSLNLHPGMLMVLLLKSLLPSPALSSQASDRYLS